MQLDSMTDDETIDWLLNTTFVDGVTKMPTSERLFRMLDERDLYAKPLDGTHVTAKFLNEVADHVRTKMKEKS